MLQKKAKVKVYDFVHKVWVSTCIGISIVATGYIGVNLYHYFTKVRPLKKEMEERFREELLKEGRMLRDKA